jgi:hypothetical protein
MHAANYGVTLSVTLSVVDPVVAWRYFAISAKSSSRNDVSSA